MSHSRCVDSFTLHFHKGDEGGASWWCDTCAHADGSDFLCRDASWELESDAYSDLLEVYKHCDSPSCLCEHGRSHSSIRGFVLLCSLQNVKKMPFRTGSWMQHRCCWRSCDPGSVWLQTCVYSGLCTTLETHSDYELHGPPNELEFSM